MGRSKRRAPTTAPGVTQQRVAGQQAAASQPADRSLVQRRYLCRAAILDPLRGPRIRREPHLRAAAVRTIALACRPTPERTSAPRRSDRSTLPVGRLPCRRGSDRRLIALADERRRRHRSRHDEQTTANADDRLGRGAAATASRRESVRPISAIRREFRRLSPTCFRVGPRLRVPSARLPVPVESGSVGQSVAGATNRQSRWR